MHTFCDTDGRTWAVEINVDAIRRVRGALGIDLLTVLDNGGELLARLHDDPVTLVDVLYVVCRPEADRRGVTDEEFGRSMSGDALLQGSEALMQGLVDFFPDARKRATLTKLLAKMRTMADRIIDHAEAVIDAIDPDSAVRSVIDSSGSSPASPGSTPDH